MGLEDKMEQALWAAHCLFERDKTSGSTANLSFLHQGKIYITGSGTCFGTLTEEKFAIVDFAGKLYNDIKPSKELPLHRYLYEKGDSVGAVIHTHSFYATLWSCLEHEDKKEDVIPKYTPYLEMKVGRIKLIPYAPPGTERLFRMFAEGIGEEKGYLLKNHGPVVAGNDIMDAFYGVEELEESAKIAWHLQDRHVPMLP